MDLPKLPEIQNRPDEIGDSLARASCAPDGAFSPVTGLKVPLEQLPTPEDLVGSAGDTPAPDITAPPQRRPAERAEVEPHAAQHTPLAKPAADSTRSEHSDHMSAAMRVEAPSITGAAGSDETPREDSNKITDGLSAERGNDVDHNSDRETSDFRSLDRLDIREYAEHFDDEPSEPPWYGITETGGPNIDVDDNQPPGDDEESADLESIPSNHRDETALKASTDEGQPSNDVNPRDRVELGEDRDSPVAHESPTHGETRTSLLLIAAFNISEKKPQDRRLLSDLLARFDTFGPERKKEATQEIFTAAADVVARAITEQNHRTELLDALSNWGVDLNRPAPSPDEMGQWCREITQALKALAKLADGLPLEILAKIGEEMLLEMLFPGTHIIIPPTDLVGAVFTAMTLLKMSRGEE